MKIVEHTFAGLAEAEINLFRYALAGMKGEAVEIGCLDGFSTAHLLECSQLHITSIDPFIPDSMAPNLIGSKARFEANTEPWKDRRTLVVDYSWNVVPAWKTPLDFLFLDGDHRYESVMRDFQEWTPFLKQNGLLAMHDSRMFRFNGANFHQGPSKVALDNVYNNRDQWEIIGEIFSLTLAKKL